MQRALYIFYKDLNIHPSLRRMARSFSFLPYFLWSEYLNHDVDDTPSLRYRLGVAKHFNQSQLPVHAQLFSGDGDIDEIIALCKLHQLTHVCMLEHYEIREKEYQQNLKSELSQANIELVLLKGYLGVDIHKTLKDKGTPYVKFTPFYKKWREKLAVTSEPYGPIEWLDQPVPFVPLLEPNIDAVKSDMRHLGHFLKKGITKYQSQRDYPYLDATSHASALINHGAVSVEDLLAYILSLPPSEGSETYIRQLAWRDFYTSIANYFPESMQANFDKRYNIPWQNNALAYQMWCSGQTGYPLVDAAMLHLFHTGRMHNRLRMVVASFLTKHLLIDWQWGAEWFKEHLVDYDTALNVGGWQWAASTGCDAVPYFRVFNPITQSEKYDPYGTFIRSEVEMLEGVGPQRIHNPLKHGIPYIAPCVDHKFATERVKLLSKNILRKV